MDSLPNSAQKPVLGLVAQSYLTHCDLVDCSLPGSSVHGDSPGKNTGVGSLSGDLPNPVIEPRSPALQVDSLLSEPPGKPLSPGDPYKL